LGSLNVYKFGLCARFGPREGLMREEEERKIKVHGGMRGRGICLRGISEERGRQARERRREAGRMHLHT
jgi:hypothetical protein